MSIKLRVAENHDFAHLLILILTDSRGQLCIHLCLYRAMKRREQIFLSNGNAIRYLKRPSKPSQERPWDDIHTSWNSAYQVRLQRGVLAMLPIFVWIFFLSLKIQKQTGSASKYTLQQISTHAQHLTSFKCRRRTNVSLPSLQVHFNFLRMSHSLGKL